MDKNKQLWIILGAIGVVVAGGGAWAFLQYSAGSGAATVADEPPPASVVPVRRPQTGGGAGQTPVAKRGIPNPSPTPLKIVTSWDRDPAAQADGKTPAPTDFGAPGAGGGASGGPSAAKPKPMVNGQVSPGFRGDPFVSLRRIALERPSVIGLALPLRLAPYPRPMATPVPSLDPNERFGPLPFVPRRVAGVLYSGAITAILETGNPPDSITEVIAPGARVKSGIIGIEDLIVESIAMDRLTLRAPDGRTVDVKLSGLPPAVADALRAQFSGGALGGGAGPGDGGGLRGGGAPGGGLGGGRID